MKRLIIREATASDYDDVVCFYDENPDEHVMIRGETAVRAAIDNGTFFIAIDTAGENSGRLCGVSAVYDVPSALDAGGTILLKEAGGSLVKESMRGFGLHKIFHAARSLHEFILDRGGFDHYFGAIILPNEPSVKNIMRMGFVQWPDPPNALLAERAPFALSQEGIGFFRCDPSSLQDHARFLLDIQNVGHLTRRAGNGSMEQIEIILSIETLKRYRPIIEEISNSGFEAIR